MIFTQKSLYFIVFRPENHCFAQFGQDLSGDPDGDDPKPSVFLMVASLPSTHRAFLWTVL